MHNSCDLHTRIRRLLGGALLTLAVLAFSWPATAQTQNDDDTGFNKGGRTGFQFLKIGVGARQAGLGEASIATVRDISAAYWNPAGISGIESYEAGFSYTRWLADMNYMAAAVGGRVRGIGTFAITAAALDYGDIPEAILNGQSDGRTGEFFSGNNMLLGLTFAREFTDNLAIGVGVKYLHETLWEYNAGALAFDVGTIYNVGFRGLTLAMAAQNFSGSVNWMGEESDRGDQGYDLPFIFRIGVAGNLLGGDALFPADPMHRVVGSVEAINTNDFSERLHFGLEYSYNQVFHARGGYRLNYAEGNWSVGAGFTPPPMSGVRLRLDYAFVSYEFLDAPHRLSVSMAF